MQTMEYDVNTGKPINREYLECGLPAYLRDSINKMNEEWKLIDAGTPSSLWDCYWCELNSDINVAEVEREISSEQAWYLREKYLRTEREL